MSFQSRSQLHRQPRGSIRTRAFFGQVFSNSTASGKTQETLKTLLTTVEQSERGNATTPSELKEIKTAFGALEEAGMGGTEKNINGAWTLIWTTEKVCSYLRQEPCLLKNTLTSMIETPCWYADLLVLLLSTCRRSSSF